MSPLWSICMFYQKKVMKWYLIKSIILYTLMSYSYYIVFNCTYFICEQDFHLQNDTCPGHMCVSIVKQMEVVNIKNDLLKIY